MVSYDNLNVSEEIKSVLRQYDVEFVFQPIYSRDNVLVGYEALMRPQGKNVLEFIEEMRQQDKLHDLELLTFFGATMEYRRRNYDKLLSINSFPADAFSSEEALAYSMCFRPIKDKLIIEILEYTEEKSWTWDKKKEHVDRYQGIEVALDDFGTGHNDMKAVDFYNPNMIKLDRTVISGIDTDQKKQAQVVDILKKMHDKMIAVLAEGVETEAEYEFLKAIGIDFFQGYYLGRPA